ncbi:di-trans,poly-cis-decaprenylcistransferase [Candidatus Saccharibacteria bacterium]|nr:di-trans,poly-cis-decaprenylcistransferase [Candidatus Saccharibacteria bacterium]
MSKISKINPQLPVHLGLILDGNRRWAKEHGLRPFEGHRRGYMRLKKVALAAFERDIKYVSAFVFSTENWQRGDEEVTYLMDLLKWIATYELNKLHKKNIRVIYIGLERGLSQDVLKAIRAGEAKTANNNGGTLVLCLNYGGQQELSDAAASLIREGVAADDVTPELLARHLYSPELPPIDFIIRTSGEQRLSGFMLWSAAYAELKFVLKHWPAFTVADLDAALLDYAGRKRRFGA